ncbi:MAG: hypothetical protein HRT53_01080 [Colwellia sp.]|nr:hypothetical protein [Colwellia sp.]
MTINSSFNNSFKLTSIALCVLLTACGGGSNSNKITDPDPTPTPAPTAPTQGKVSGPHSTGSINEPVFVYYDLDNKAIIELTAEQAKTNTAWDIAFKRSGVYLNQHSDNTVKAYATGNNSDFFDVDGKVIPDSFITASAESELDDYLAVKTSDIPADETMFTGDVTSNIIDGFYNYDSTTHIVTAAETNYFIANSDNAFTKFRASSITTVGRGIGQITLQTAYQSSSDAQFATEQELIIDAALTCSGDVTHVYVDFDTNQEVTINDAWDINFPCATDKTSADFTINIADDAQAMHDFDNNYNAVDPSAVAYYGMQSNIYSVKAFDDTPWYQYGINGGHLLWSQFDVYLIQTATKTHKLQLTSYYDADGVSGNISFRADEVNELAGETGS